LSRSDFWFGIGFMILGVIVFLLTTNMMTMPIGLSPADYPRVIAVGLIILGAIQAIQGWRKGSPSLKELYPSGAIWRMLGLVVITYVYIQLLDILGFSIASPLFLLVVMYYFGVRRPVTMIAIAVLLTLIIYLIFRVAFHVPLPRFNLF
jgi:putative tricarboxylic transport membrane protein